MNIKKFLILTDPANHAITNSVTLKVYPNSHIGVRFTFITTHSNNFENRVKFLLNNSFPNGQYRQSTGVCTVVIEGPKNFNKIAIRFFLNKVYKFYKQVILTK